jgi:MSHA biogenesis protein MshN
LMFVAPHLPGKATGVEHERNPSRSAPIVLPAKVESVRAPIEGLPSEAEMAPKPIPHTQLEKPIQEVNTSVALPASTPAAIDKQMREIAPSEGAEISFRKGAAQLQDGRANKAEMEFREALNQDPSHAGALQALLNLLLTTGRNHDAEQLVRTALETNPHQPRLAMVLARLEVERGEVPGAINTLVTVLPYAQSDSELYAFLAALLQREGRHKDAVEYYRAALRSAPGNGVWTMGLGISLRGSNQPAEAREAFTRAADSGQLSPDLQEFVQRQLRELSPQKKK